MSHPQSHLTNPKMVSTNYSALQASLNNINSQTAQVRFSIDVAGNNLSKYLMLRHVQDQNERLFYHYIRGNIKHSLPYIYTPSVGDACEQYSYLNFAPRGLYFSYRGDEQVNETIDSITHDVDVIVVTDGSRVLGLGDLGIGGMGISIGKLSLYTAVGGIAPQRTLPVCIDLGTNNPKLKQDPQYLGDKGDRIDDNSFYSYLDEIMQALSARWPKAIIQFEDFSNNHAYPLLEKYRYQYPCFNDDIQGTATVSAATIKRALLKAGKTPATARIFVVGGGSAGCGIGQLIEGTFGFEQDFGVCVIDREGLLFEDSNDLSAVQKSLARPVSERPAGKSRLSLIEAIEHYQPDVLVGVTGMAGLFDEATIKTLAANTQTPIVMPLSNPVSACEVTPQQVFDWIGRDVIVATGSPFTPVQYDNQSYTISQCNNVYVFPGIGLGAKVVNATTISDGMLNKAVDTLATFNCTLCSDNEVLPAIENTIDVSKAIAIAVAKQAIEECLTDVTIALDDEQIAAMIEQAFWQPDMDKTAS